MSKKSEFLKFLNELLATASEETINKMSDDVKNYIEFLEKIMNGQFFPHLKEGVSLTVV